MIFASNHDSPACAACLDTGRMVDANSYDPDGLEYVPCTQCDAAHDDDHQQEQHR